MTTDISTSVNLRKIMSLDCALELVVNMFTVKEGIFLLIVLWLVVTVEECTVHCPDQRLHNTCSVTTTTQTSDTGNTTTNTIIFIIYI